MKSNTEIIEELRKSRHGKVRVAITDIDGVLRGKFMHKDKFISAAEGDGFGFCNVVFGWDINDECYDYVDYTGWHTGYPDANARVDLNTHRTTPWNDGLPFFLADFVDETGGPLAVCPRQLLKKVVEKADAMGYNPGVGMEFEWFNFRETAQNLQAKNYTAPEPLTPGMFGYSLLRSGQSQEYFMALIDELADFGVPLEGIHTETGPGVYEAAIMYGEALESADRAVLFKQGAKEIAHRFGIIPSFMAKWDPKLPGCSGHIHQSLRDKESGVNRFHDENDPNKMSEIFKHYVAGQMLLLPEILPFYAPTINSFKRLVEGLWAPTRVTWGLDNRTASLRVIPGSAKSTRIETRVPGSDCNPYLAMAAAVATGLYGIEHKLELEPPVKGNAYEAKDAVRLPANLLDATEKMAASKIARELFGDAFIEHFAASRRWEWNEFQKAVTDWEMKRYFEIV